MSLARLRAQDVAVGTLRRALQLGKVHHAYRFEGPAGVGKELAALALAQALLCEAPTPEACGQCRACRLAASWSDEAPRLPQHPDLVLLQRGLYPPSSLGPDASAEATQLGVHQVRRLVLGRLGFPPHEGRALVFIIRDADELSLSAANLLLKTLEEPPPQTYFVLLTSRPARLLDTVRSRTLAVRFHRLPDAVVEELLALRSQPKELAALGQGSIGMALELAHDEHRQAREDFLARAQVALTAGDLRPSLGLVDKGTERGELRLRLLFLAQALAQEAARALSEAPSAARVSAERHAIVLAALRQLEGNVAPALAVESMMIQLRRVG